MYRNINHQRRILRPDCGRPSTTRGYGSGTSLPVDAPRPNVELHVPVSARDNSVSQFLYGFVADSAYLGKVLNNIKFPVDLAIVNYALGNRRDQYPAAI